MLYDYMKQVERFLRDGTQKLIDPQDIVSYVNRARREVAMRSECIRVLTPIQNAVQSLSIVAGGTGYTNPSITISTPDFPSGAPPNPGGLQATAAVGQVGGVITVANVTNGGSGYFQPTVTINDPTGSGAEVNAIVGAYNALQENQEVYYFRDINLAAFPGVGAIFNLRSISIVYANYRFSLPIYSFSVYQANVRNFPFQFLWVPSFGTQFGRGAAGSVYLYPIASQTYQQEWDVSALPLDLQQDTDVEAIPQPWTDAVPWLATSYAFAELQNLKASDWHMAKFNEWMSRYGTYTLRGRRVNPYGRWVIPLTVGISALLEAAAHSLTGVLV